MANRTLQFYGYAYGNTPVQLNAHINGEVVFSGAVTTQDQPIPLTVDNMALAPVLFSVENSTLFPTEFEGSYPMTISVATGDGIALGQIYCNYMANNLAAFTNQFWSDNSTISNTTLTIGTITSGAVAVGQRLCGANVPGKLIVGGSGSEWTLGWPTPDIGPMTIGGGVWANTPGNATSFVSCYNGSPVNSDNSSDSRSSVTIDDVPQTLIRNGNNGTWTWIVPQGSTIAYNLNVSVGNTA